MALVFNSENIRIYRIDDCKRSRDSIEVSVHTGHEEMSIECTENLDTAFVFIDKAGAIELRDALNHFIQGTRPTEDRAEV